MGGGGEYGVRGGGEYGVGGGGEYGLGGGGEYGVGGGGGYGVRGGGQLEEFCRVLPCAPLAKAGFENFGVGLMASW